MADIRAAANPVLRGLLLAATALLAACGGGGGPDADDLPAPVAQVPAAPPIPALRPIQVDRMGRSAINTALTQPLAAAPVKNAARDAYNAAPAEQWQTFRAGFRASLAVYDGLDTVCGNQLLASNAADESRYDTLAGALVDDRLYVNAASGSCTQYFAVELNATGVLANSDCGGRTLTYDTVDTTYTAVTNDLSVAVGDGVDMDSEPHDDANFPFLAEFNPPPSPPALLATQVDRMGRSGVNTALVSPLLAAGPRGVARDAYNAAAQADWGMFTTDIRASLAVYDGVDTVCGNQVLASGANDPSRYDTLAGALTDDRLYVNGASGTCNQYLGVELNATGLVANNDCAGRTPLYDTIDVTYTALINDLSVPFGDGVPVDDGVPSNTVFPFLADPLVAP